MDVKKRGSGIACCISGWYGAVCTGKDAGTVLCINHLVDDSYGCKYYAVEFVNEAVECHEVSFASDCINLMLLCRESFQWSSHLWWNLHDSLLLLNPSP